MPPNDTNIDWETSLDRVITNLNTTRWKVRQTGESLRIKNSSETSPSNKKTKTTRGRKATVRRPNTELLKYKR
jgi:hypothetical protein